MRPRYLMALVLAGLIGTLAAAGAQRSAAPVLEVYKTPTCGCCGNWVAYLRAEGFTVNVTDLDDLSDIKRTNKVPANLQSCHTAKAGDYVIEGHVPAGDIKKLLSDRPAVAGIAVAGMPIGSPGMEVAGVQPQRFDVMAFDGNGKSHVFASH